MLVWEETWQMTVRPAEYTPKYYLEFPIFCMKNPFKFAITIFSPNMIFLVLVLFTKTKWKCSVHREKQLLWSSCFAYLLTQ